MNKEKECIDKHEAYLLLKQKAETYMLPATKEAYEKAAILIGSLPTIEPEPVKHGRWIDFPECLEYEGALDEEYFVCSECHHVWNTIDNCAETFRYCPNCGSKNEDGDKSE